MIICGPKSAPIAQKLLDTDPYLEFVRTDERWWIVEKAGKKQSFDSPYRRAKPTRVDVGYFSRHLMENRVIVHIAGITSVGSLGVARWLEENLATIFRGNEGNSLSGVVECKFDQDFAVTDTRLVAGPYAW